MKKWKAYIMENIGWLAVILFIALVMTATMLLNRIAAREIGYGMLLCIFVTGLAVSIGYARHRGSFFQLELMRQNIAEISDDMKKPEYMYEKQYQDCITAIAKEKDRIQNEMLKRQQDMSEYYSMWVHQIKTPIAALNLLLNEQMNEYLEDDSIEEDDACMMIGKQMRQELFRIEQYVDMALQYTRLGASTNDFVIQKVNIDEVIKASVHKYAEQFIHKKLRLTYVPQNIAAVTDKKWLGFVIDQLLSNAVKYTKQGSVTIYTEQTQSYEKSGYSEEEREKLWYERSDKSSESSVHIIIEDTGIGISAEDLPRICEKGYTGYNGHADKYSTGIGLYLCREIVDRLGHQLVITSNKGAGTRAEIIITCSEL